MGNDPNEDIKENPLGCPIAADADIDLSLLKDSLAKTPWERMLANDDALNFADSLRAAMEARNAKLQPTAHAN